MTKTIILIEVSLNIGSSDAIQLPVDDSSTRPSGANVSVGQIRYNSQLEFLEGYRESDGNPEWEGLGNTAAPGQLLEIPDGNAFANVTNSNRL